jgi:hypothetical protein
MTDATRVVLIKPGDVLLIGNVGENVDYEALPDLAEKLKSALGIAHVAIFEADIDLASVPIP